MSNVCDIVSTQAAHVETSARHCSELDHCTDSCYCMYSLWISRSMYLTESIQHAEMRTKQRKANVAIFISQK